MENGEIRNRTEEGIKRAITFSKMTVKNNYRKMISYLLVQRVILFLAYYEYLNRLYAIATNGPQGELQNLYYNYDYAGNITTITDYLDGSRTQNFQYDHLHRLTQAYSPAYGTLTYNYNEIGNMTYNSRVGSYSYWKDYYGTKPHAVRYAGSYSYEYDANGNMTMRNGVTITYDYDNRPVLIGSTVLVYDYSGQRVKKNSTVYIGKIYECNGSSCTKYIFAGSTRIASQSSSKTYFYHTDHLGSSSVITDELGNKAQETYYYPFGETWYNSGNATHYKFTGQEEDPETGLYYYGARYYDPVIGRFISADSIVPDFSNPQTLNRYSYCINNPIILTDPNGHDFGLSILIGAIIGAVISGAQSDWNFQAMLTGGIIGGISGGVFSGVEGGVAGAIKNSVANATLRGAISGAAGGAAAGAVAGGLSTAFYGGNFFENVLIGAGTGAVIGGVMGAIKGATIDQSTNNMQTKESYEQVEKVFRVQYNPETKTFEMAKNFMSVGYKAANIIKGMRQFNRFYNDLVTTAYKIECNVHVSADVIVHQYSYDPPTFNYIKLSVGSWNGPSALWGPEEYIPVPIRIIGQKGCPFLQIPDDNLYWRQGTISF